MFIDLVKLKKGLDIKFYNRYDNDKSVVIINCNYIKGLECLKQKFFNEDKDDNGNEYNFFIKIYMDEQLHILHSTNEQDCKKFIAGIFKHFKIIFDNDEV